MPPKAALDIPLMLYVGTAIMLLLMMSVIFFVVIYQRKVMRQQNRLRVIETEHQRKMLQASLRAQEVERGKISTNLHDDLGSVLNTAKLHVTRLRKTSEEDPQLESAIDNIASLLDMSITQVRGIARDLMPPILSKFGLVKGLEELCKRISSAKFLSVECHESGEKVALTNMQEVQLYRMAQEVLNNIVKHANAKKMDLYINWQHNRIQIVVQHNGQGLSQDKLIKLVDSDSGVGLKSIMSRAEAINAMVTYNKKDIPESNVVIELNCENEED